MFQTLHADEQIANFDTAILEVAKNLDTNNDPITTNIRRTKVHENQPWFEAECFTCKKKLKYSLANCRRNNFDPESKQKFIAKKSLKKSALKSKNLKKIVNQNFTM